MDASNNKLWPWIRNTLIVALCLLSSLVVFPGDTQSKESKSQCDLVIVLREGKEFKQQITIAHSIDLQTCREVVDHPFINEDHRKALDRLNADAVLLCVPYRR